jgi:hypothetical protein
LEPLSFEVLEVERNRAKVLSATIVPVVVTPEGGG